MQTAAASEAPTAAEKVRPAQLPLEGLSEGLNLLNILTQAMGYKRDDSQGFRLRLSLSDEISAGFRTILNTSSLRLQSFVKLR
jgi:hypothetical protein